MGVLRWLARAFLIVLFGLLVSLSILTLWVRGVVTNTDRFVAAVGPLASEPAIQRQATVVVMGYLDRAAAGGLESLSPVTRRALQVGYTAARPRIEQTVQEVVESAAFESLWEAAMRQAHQEISAVLSGEPLPLTTESNGVVEADLTAVYTEVQTRPHDAGITLLDDVSPTPDQLTIELFPSREIEELRRYVRWLNQAAIWLPIAAAIAGVLYVFLSPNRWRGAFWLAVALVLGTLLVGLVIWLGRTITGNQLGDASAREAALAIYDSIARTLLVPAITIAVVGGGLALVLLVLGWRRGRQPATA